MLRRTESYDEIAFNKYKRGLRIWANEFCGRGVLPQEMRRRMWEKWHNYRILVSSKAGRERDPRERKVLRRWWTRLWGTSRVWQPSARRYLRLRFKIARGEIKSFYYDENASEKEEITYGKTHALRFLRLAFFFENCSFAPAPRINEIFRK